MMIENAGAVFSLRYSFAGQFMTHEEWIHPTRVIDTWEVMLVTQGEVHLREGNASYHLHAGDLMLLRPFVEHGGTQSSQGRTSFFWGHFTTDAFERTGLRGGVCTPPDIDRLVSAFRCLLHVGNTPGYPPYATDAALAALLSEVAASQAVSGADSSRLIQEVTEWVRINSSKKLTVQMVSAHFSYHPDYLCALMRRTFGQGLKEYINEERLKRLKTLLLTSSLSVKELAAQLGFGNENQLIHYFKYHEGISPARFRNQYAHTHLNRQ